MRSWIKYIDNNLVWNKTMRCLGYYELILYNYSLPIRSRNLSYEQFPWTAHCTVP